jgi:hypothetical protein
MVLGAEATWWNLEIGNHRFSTENISSDSIFINRGWAESMTTGTQMRSKPKARRSHGEDSPVDICQALGRLLAYHFCSMLVGSILIWIMPRTLMNNTGQTWYSGTRLCQGGWLFLWCKSSGWYHLSATWRDSYAAAVLTFAMICDCDSVLNSTVWTMQN